MRFTSGGKNVEVKNGQVTVDGKKVSHEEAERLTDTTFISGSDAPINLGGTKKTKNKKSWDWTA